MNNTTLKLLIKRITKTLHLNECLPNIRAMLQKISKLLSNFLHLYSLSQNNKKIGLNLKNH